jgi:4-hydroxybenzoate polyprenyltransferase
MPLLNKAYGEIMIRHHANFNYILFWISGFGFFAFLTTLLREIIKDAEDYEGDSAYGMNTIPVVLGTRATKIIILALILICFFLLLWVLVRFILLSSDFTDYLSGLYFLFFLFIPFAIIFIRIINAGSKRDYYITSQITKGIMVTGILYAFLVRYIILFEIK